MHRLWWTGAYDKQELAHYEKIRHDPEKSTAFQLQKVISTTQEEAHRCGIELMNIRYEDFVSDPAGVIGGILEAAGLPSSKWIDRKLHMTPVQDRNRQ
jgi:LPS sulfotransferase NodH